MARQIELSVMSFSFASDRILSKIDKILTSFLSSELLDLLLLFIVFCAIINPSSKLLDNGLISPERRGGLIEKGNKKPYDVIDSQRSQRYERSNFFPHAARNHPGIHFSGGGAAANSPPPGERRDTTPRPIDTHQGYHAKLSKSNAKTIKSHDFTRKFTLKHSKREF